MTRDPTLLYHNYSETVVHCPQKSRGVRENGGRMIRLECAFPATRFFCRFLATVFRTCVSPSWHKQSHRTNPRSHRKVKSPPPSTNPSQRRRRTAAPAPLSIGELSDSDEDARARTPVPQRQNTAPPGGMIEGTTLGPREEKPSPFRLTTKGKIPAGFPAQL